MNGLCALNAVFQKDARLQARERQIITSMEYFSKYCNISPPTHAHHVHTDENLLTFVAVIPLVSLLQGEGMRRPGTLAFAEGKTAQMLPARQHSFLGTPLIPGTQWGVFWLEI